MTAIVSVRPIVLAAADRGHALEVRVTAPATGRNLPIILFSHGYGSSLDGYAPLVDDWAAHGFVVIQPTHLDSRKVGLPLDDPRRPSIWRTRVDDMKRALDELATLEQAVPGLCGRTDPSRVAAVGHSFGGQTAGMLLGARMLGPDGEPGEDLSDSRIKAGVLLAAAGRGGRDLSPWAAENFPYIQPGFATLTTPTLVVAGDSDNSPLTVRGPDWFVDPYTFSPGARAFVSLVGGEHMLGGISGYDVKETTDESRERVAVVQRASWAFLRSALYPGDRAWAEACAALASSALARVEQKPSAPQRDNDVPPSTTMT